MSPTTMTRAEAEALTGELVRTQLEKQKITAAMELRITTIRKEHEGRLDTLIAQESAKIAALREWAESNPQEFPKGERSILFVHARIGLRTNPPKVEKVGKKLTWENVLDNMRRIARLRPFIRTPPEEINKQALIDARDQLAPDDLQSAGLRISQSETFFVEPVAEGADLGCREAS